MLKFATQKYHQLLLYSRQLTELSKMSFDRPHHHDDYDDNHRLGRQARTTTFYRFPSSKAAARRSVIRAPPINMRIP